MQPRAEFVLTVRIYGTDIHFNTHHLDTQERTL